MPGKPPPGSVANWSDRTEPRPDIGRFQCVFDAAMEAINVHSPDMPADRRIAFATSIAIRARETFR